MKNSLIFGIQGGKGSFNEEVLLDYVKKQKVKDYKVKYLYTTDKVLKELSQAKIDYGLFAIQNSIAGVVEESINVLSKYKFKIKEELKLKIGHFLMKRKNSKIEDIKIVISHPQVFKQCAKTLKRNYPKLKQVIRKGDLIDPAKVAEALSKGEIDKNTAVLGNKRLSQIYNLGIIDKDLQDNKENYTEFLLVERG